MNKVELTAAYESQLATISVLEAENTILRSKQEVLLTKASKLPKINLWNIWKYRNEIIEIIEMIISLFSKKSHNG